MAARRRGLLSLATVVIPLGVLAVLAVEQASTVRASLTTLRHLNWEWIPLALGAAAGSMGFMARGQRRLLRVSGTKLPLKSAIAVTYASNALSVSLPLAGPGVGTAFSFRQFRRRGIDTVAAGWALTVSGVMSSLAFALLMAVGALVSDNPAGSMIGLSTAAVSGLPVLALLFALRFTSVRRVLSRLVRGTVALAQRWFGHPGSEAADALETMLGRAAALRATPSQYILAFTLAVQNWTADCVCLGAAIAATGQPVPWRGVILAYCLAIAAGSFGITPGGVGVVEVALTASLVAAHLPADRALPAVVIYRLISFWLVMAVGWIVVAGLARRERSAPAADPTPAQSDPAQPPPREITCPLG